MQLDFSFSRTNHTFWGQWLWTTDLISLFATLILMGFGTLLIMAASPAVAHTYGYGTFFFFKKHLFFTLLALGVLFSVSHMSLVTLRRTAFVGFALCLLLLWATLLLGTPIKGAKRWLSLMGLQLQPSELLKPCFVIVVAWLLSESKRLTGHFQGQRLCVLLACLTVVPLLLQPDIGMTFGVVVVFVIQLFLGGLSYLLLLGSGLLGAIAFLVAFFCFPHVRHRLESFLYPELGNPFGDQFQTLQALSAIQKGGWFGVGLGEGTVKLNLPDAHTDFIFAVAAEEFGLLFCVTLLGLYALIIARAFWYALNAQSLFKTLAIAGLASCLAVQVSVNVASVLGLIPTKGMPLPFISYGGSSMLSSALVMAFLLAFTRKRFY